jgi:hypothetical protein
MGAVGTPPRILAPHSPSLLPAPCARLHGSRYKLGRRWRAAAAGHLLPPCSARHHKDCGSCRSTGECSARRCRASWRLCIAHPSPAECTMHDTGLACASRPPNDSILSPAVARHWSAADVQRASSASPHTPMRSRPLTPRSPHHRENWRIPQIARPTGCT